MKQSHLCWWSRRSLRYAVAWNAIVRTGASLVLYAYTIVYGNHREECMPRDTMRLEHRLVVEPSRYTEHRQIVSDDGQRQMSRHKAGLYYCMKRA